jgi:hypothetical protein
MRKTEMPATTAHSKASSKANGRERLCTGETPVTAVFSLVPPKHTFEADVVVASGGHRMVGVSS